jgi:tripartite-type tricarboxylate transporter receptor subunit TctC
LEWVVILADPMIAGTGDDMVIKLSRRLALALIAGAASVAAVHAQTADWPSRPIRIIVPAPAGGPYDS